MIRSLDSRWFKLAPLLIIATCGPNGTRCLAAPPPADGALEQSAEAQIQLGGPVVELAQGPGQAAAPAKVQAGAKPPANTKPANTKPPASKPQAAPLDNPLKNVLRGLFRKSATRKPLLPRVDGLDLIPASEDRAVRDPIDALGPHDPNVASALRSVQQQIDSERWQQALEILQKILERSDDSLVRTTAGHSLSVRVIANRLLGGLNQELLKSYRLQHGGRAEQLLSEAERSGDPQLLVRVATLYFHTPAGYRAANHLGTLHFDRGEFAMAAKWYLQLLNANTEHVSDPRWRLKTAVALREAGHRERSLELLEQASTEPTIELGGRSVEFKTWFEQLQPLNVQSDRALDDWGMLYGSASRTGTAQGSDPVLLPRWSHPLTQNAELRRQIFDLTQDLRDEKRALVGAMFPTLIDGKLAFRTLRGIQLVDVDNGRRLWQTREGISAETLLLGGGRAQKSFSTMVRGGMGPGLLKVVRMVPQYKGKTGEHHPLANLLFRNGVYGLSSSDGHRLFVVEDHAIMSTRQPGYSFGRPSTQRDAFRRNWSTNKLVAYDLKTGRPAWEVGGNEMNEQFDLPLAGNYFFGVPAVDDGELFVVGEKGDEIRVFSLDAASGRVHWSQRIAYCDAKIDRDFGRRWWMAQVAVHNGILVCPTTVGWLVAVDRLNHSLLWAHRYTKPQTGSKSTAVNRPGNSRSSSLVPATQLNERWSPSAPVISGNRVIYTPSEDKSIFCLDLMQGRQLWKSPKRSFLYLAGVFDQQVVLVGATSVVSLSLDKGLQRWAVKLSVADGRPSGRGVTVGDRFFLPLDSGQLWTLDLKQGKVVQRSALVDGSPPLGNLSMYRGLLVSIGAHGVRTFEQRDAIRAEIDRLIAKDADDPRALLLEARITRLELQHEKTRSLLSRIDADRLDADGREKHRQMMVHTLADAIRQDPGQHGDELKQLGQWVQSKEEQVLFQRLLSDNLLANKQYVAALDIYLQVIASDTAPLVQRVDRRQTQVRLDLWAAGKLIALWAQIPDSQKSEMSQLIEQRVVQAEQGSVGDRQRLLQVFGFHPAADRIRQQLVKDHVQQGRLTESLALLDVGARSADRRVQAAALWKAGSVLSQRELNYDAAIRFQRLEREFADVALSDGETIREKLAALRTAGDWPRERQAPIGWKANGVRVRRSGTSYYSNHTRVMESDGLTEPSLQRLKFELHQQLNRLSVVDAASDNMKWSLPLRIHTGNGSVGAAVQAVGHRIVVMHRGVIHCLSPVERRLLWSHALQSRGGSANRSVRSGSSARYRFVKGTAIVQQGVRARAGARQRSGLAIVNDQYLCVYDRRGFVVLDIQDGSLRWKHRTGSADVRVTGTPDCIYVLPPTGTPLAFRALDGKAIEIKNLSGLLAKTVQFVGNDCLTVESSNSFSLFGLGGSKTRLRLADPIRGKTLWTLDLPTNTALARLNDGSLITLGSDGQLGQLDQHKGAIRKFATVEGGEGIDWKKNNGVVAVTDADRLYLAVGDGTRFGSYYYNTPTIPVNGQLLAFDRHTRKFLWKQSVEKQNLVVSQMSYTPILLLMNFQYERKMNFGFSSMQLMAIDKRNGHILVNEKLASSGLQAVTTNMAERYVEVRTYNMRIRLLASDTEAAASN